MKQVYFLFTLFFLLISGLVNTKSVSNSDSSVIKNIILLVMENHSFDNMLGWFKGNLSGKEYNLEDPNNSSSKKYFVGKGASYQTIPDCPHNFLDVQKQLFGTKQYPIGNDSIPTMNGFSWAYPKSGNKQNPMNLYTKDQVPIISALADNFLLFDQWFSSVPGPTDPNKLFFHAATSNGQTGSCLPDWYCSSWTTNANTIFQQMNSENITWKVHWQDWNELFAVYPLNQENEKIIHDPDFENFFSELQKGTLNQYNYLIPRAYDSYNGKKANTQHPSQDIRYGEQLMKKVYEEFRQSRYWNDTLLIITYDEHGGFYDSVIPPGNVVNPTPQYSGTPNDFNFTRLGVRVPGILISPWVSKKTTSLQVEHASVPKTVRNLLKMKSDYLTPREKNANLLIDQFLPKARTDCPLTLPEVPFDQKLFSQKFQEETEIKQNNSHSSQKLDGAANSMFNIVAEMLIKKNILTQTEYKNLKERKIQTNQQAVEFAQIGLKILGHQIKDQQLIRQTD